MITGLLKRIAITITLVIGMVSSVYATPLLTDWTNAAPNSATGTLGSVSVSFFSSSGTIWNTVFEGSFFSNTSIYNPAIASTKAISFRGDRSTSGYHYTVTFSGPVENPVIYIASLASVLTFDPSISLTKISGEDVFIVSDNTVSGVTDNIKKEPNNDANGIFRINGIVTNFSFDAAWKHPTGTGDDGIYMQIEGNPVVDADGDGYSSNIDCDDTNPAIHPSTYELPGNTIDENCDGSLGACDPDAFWKNHGQFVRCVVSEVAVLVNQGVITRSEAEALITSAAQSDIGKQTEHMFRRTR